MELGKLALSAISALTLTFLFGTGSLNSLGSNENSDGFHNLSLDVVDGTITLKDSDTVVFQDTEPDEVSQMSSISIGSEKATVKIPAQNLIDLDSPTLVSVIDDNSITLVWEEFETRVTDYQILRDGEVLGISADESWTDESVTSGKNYQYEVSAEVLARPEFVTTNDTAQNTASVPIEVDGPTEGLRSEAELQQTNIGTSEENAGDWEEVEYTPSEKDKKNKRPNIFPGNRHYRFVEY